MGVLYYHSFIRKDIQTLDFQNLKPKTEPGFSTKRLGLFAALYGRLLPSRCTPCFVDKKAKNKLLMDWLYDDAM